MDTTATPTAAPDGMQEFAFQAEITRLLDLLAHSLYQSKEIAVRELVSNASDALDKLRHLSLTDPGRVGPVAAGDLSVSLQPDKDAGMLTIADNGVGMTRDELVANLGTIAKSGSLDFLARLSGDAKKDVSLIGQFGVGFYAAFMLADRVEVRSRSALAADGEPAHRWESDGSGRFTVAPLPEGGPARGTEVVLHLKADVKGEYTDAAGLRRVLQKYSGFLNYPITVAGERANEVRPIWLEPRSQVTTEQYQGFYQHLTHRGSEKPLWHLHLSVDSPIQFHAVLFCPPSNVELMGFGKAEHGLHLCAKRVLVQEECRELLPEYLRFVVGLVDSQDLPLNISRETLQDSSVLRRIKTTLVRKVLDRLLEMAAEEQESYSQFYRQFGPVLKEGIHEDFDKDNRQKIAKLLRFVTTGSEDAEPATGLDEVVGRMVEGQTRLYYLGGPDLAALRKNPNLEIFRKKGVEVLLLTEPVDEFVLSRLGEYDGKPLTSIDAAELDLPPGGEAAGEEGEAAPPGDLAKVITLFKRALGDRVKDVRASTRLTDAPVCLVSGDGMSAQMERILRQMNQQAGSPGGFGGQRTLEVNPRSPLIRRLAALSHNLQHDPFIEDCGWQLFAGAMALEGVVIEPEETVRRAEAVMRAAAEKLSPILTA